MKKGLTLIIGLLACFTLFAQPKGYTTINANEKANFAANLSKELAKVKSIACDFNEEKHSSLLTEITVTKGLMRYQQPSSIRWEYTEPNKMQFVLHNNKASVGKDGKVSENSNRMVREMAKLIAKIISGASITNEKEFSVNFFTNAESIWVEMKPKNAQLKQIYSKIEMQIDKKTNIALQIIMHEVNGDFTVTKFNNHQINNDLPANSFQL